MKNLLVLILILSSAFAHAAFKHNAVHEICQGSGSISAKSLGGVFRKSLDLTLRYDDTLIGGERHTTVIQIKNNGKLYRGSKTGTADVVQLQVANTVDASDVIFDGTITNVHGGIQLNGRYSAKVDQNIGVISMILKCKVIAE